MPTIDLLSPPAETDSDAITDAINKARAFLDGGGDEAAPAALPAEVGEALVRALVARGDAKKLSALAGVKDKALAKQARRGIHLLRAQGMKADVPRPAFESHAQPAPEPEIPSLVTMPFADGECMVWYVQPSVEDARLDVFQVQLSDKAGVGSIEHYRPTRKQWRDIERSIVGEARVKAARMPRRWARWLLEMAYEREEAAGRSPSRAFLGARLLMEEARRYDEHPVLSIVPAAAIEKAVQAGAPERALELPETKSWIPEQDAAKKAFDEIQSLEHSPLVLDERVQLERIADILGKAAAESLATDWRERLGRRFLDMAYYLMFMRPRAHDGAPATPATDERDYLADAALCVVASRAVTDDSTAAGENRVALALFKRVLDTLPKTKAAKEEKRTPGGLIFP